MKSNLKYRTMKNKSNNLMPLFFNCKPNHPLHHLWISFLLQLVRRTIAKRPIWNRSWMRRLSKLSESTKGQLMVWQRKTSMWGVMERDLRLYSSKLKTDRILVDSPMLSGHLLSRKSTKMTRVKNQWYSIWLTRESINAKMSIKLSDAVVIGGHA